jgi:RimJ/RimL family protein N-acetyltransferase
MKRDLVFLEGRKIYLRPFLEKDISTEYLRWINNHKISSHLEVSRFPSSLIDMKNFFKSQKELKKTIFFSICLKKNRKHIGNCSLSNIDWINRRAQYGRLIGDQGNDSKGAGTETLKILQNYAFNKLNLNTIWTGVSEANKYSIKSNIKAGMKKVGKFPESIFYEGKYYNLICFCLTKSEYKKIE